VLFLFRLLQFRSQFFLRLAFTELSADLRGEFQAFKWGGDYIVGAQIQRPRTLEGAALHNHQDANRFRLVSRFDLCDQAAAAQVRRRRFRDEQIRLERFDLLDVQAGLVGDVVSLTRKCLADFVGRAGARIDDENSHALDIITVVKYRF
jgi:hypothetical protein